MSRFIQSEGNPAPAGGSAFDFHAEDGGRLRAAVFDAPHARGGVVLCGGRVEYLEKYFEVVADLHARGLSVATFDWRGQGLSDRMLSDPMKGHIDSFATFRNDLRQFTEKIALTRLPKPHILLTHSMGGAPALQLLADGYDRFSAAVLCAPMTRLFDNRAARIGARLGAALFSAIGAGSMRIAGVKEHSLAFEGNVLTSDARRHARFLALQNAEQQALIREPTYGWLHAATAAMDDLHAPHRFDGLVTPVRIISAGRDALVSSSDHLWLAEQSPLIDCVVVPDAFHEIMMESDELREEFWKAFDDFVEPRIASA